MSNVKEKLPSLPAPSLFARRISRLEQVSIELRHLHRDHARCIEAEKRQKAALYLESDARSHGEREALASAQAVDYAVESIRLKADIAALEEERDFLKFCIEYDVGE